MFKIGQKVVCVDNSGCSELILNKIYTIYEIIECMKCHTAGLVLNISTYMYTEYCRCCQCGNRRKTRNEKHSYNSKRFRPLDYDIISNKDIIGELTEEKADVEIKEPQKV